jgi:hypothetical protein
MARNGSIAKLQSMPPSSPSPMRWKWKPPHVQATPEEAGATLAIALTFAYIRRSRARHHHVTQHARRRRTHRCRRAMQAILSSEDRVRDAALWDLLDDHHPALVRWARCMLGCRR